MIDLNLGVSLLVIGGVMFAVLMISSTSCFSDKLDRFIPISLAISAILVGVGVVIITVSAMFV